MTYAIKNGVWTTVVTGITNVATSLTVAAGDGAKFGSPSTTNPVRCVVVDTSTTPETIKEYIDVTAVSTDTLTIIREVEESTRFPKVALTAGWYVAPVVTVAVLYDTAKLLAVQNYSGGNPFSWNTGSGTFIDVDATNAAVTFTPKTTAAVVTVTGRWTIPGGATAVQLYDVGASAAIGSQRILLASSSYDLSFYISGLTVGTSKTLKIQWKSIVGGQSSTLFAESGNSGPLLIAVQAA